MPVTIFSSRDLWDEMMKLYNAEDYAGAYRLAQDGLGRFPEDRYHLRWACICLAARTEKPDVALSMFEDSLEEGDWFGDEMLSGDHGDLDSLRGLPRFEELVARSLEMQDLACKSARPSLKLLEPVGKLGGPPSLLVGLYGNAANVESAVEAWGPAANHGWTVALPESSQMSGPNIFVWNDEARAFREIRSHMDKLFASNEFDSSRRVIGGFSRGGQVAMRASMSGAIDVPAFLAICPSIRDLEEWRPFFDSAADLRVRGHVIAGEDDSTFADATRDLERELASSGLDVRVELRTTLGHQFPPNFSDELPTLLQELAG